MEYIDDTDVTIDNRDITTTEIEYPNGIRYSVDIRFALMLVENALENTQQGVTEIMRDAIRVLEEALIDQRE